MPDADAPTLPTFVEGGALEAAEVVIETVTSEPLPRLTRAGLVGALIETGLSVESAVTGVEGLLAAEYLSGDESLTLTERGHMVSTYLAEVFDELTSPTYAAQLHAGLVQIASGERERLEVLRAFWSRFAEVLKPASSEVEASTSVAAHKPIVLRPIEEV
jgi:DNA topoisomerase-1